nr:PREDICTED: uncharacterized protein LOC108199114 isoform X1 [Daucus carota subsp. sativus]XP_017222357.1 PREDICTED: uncharacterized protein LOC108199114 isoform X1 [Daucus carota subsp. sativus]
MMEQQQQQQMPTVFDDHIIRGFEQEYRKAVAKVFIRNHGDKGWTGFIVSLSPTVVITVAHAVGSFPVHQVFSEDQFYLKFYDDPAEYKARALKCSFKSDLLMLHCELRPSAVSFFEFADHTSPLLSSTSLLCISHPAQRDWVTLRGTVCRVPFLMGENENYDHNMQLFDHDAQCFPGSSGAPITDLRGRVIGMNFSEYTIKEHCFCVPNNAKETNLSTYQDGRVVPHQIKELTFLPCNVKQGITLQYIAQTIRSFFQDEGFNDVDMNLNNYVRRSAIKYIMKEAKRKNQGKQPSQTPQGKRPREQRPAEETTEESNVFNPCLSISEGHGETCLGDIKKCRKSEQIEAPLDVEVVSFNLDMSIASHEPKVTTRVGHKFDQKTFSLMKQALEIQAKLAPKFPSFVKNMLPSHVAGGFWLGIPKNFSDMHLPKHDETVVLIDETELEHETKYFFEKNGLGVGWRGFSITHKLQENDVLVFHLIQECKFKVYIVRANALTGSDGSACVEEMNCDHGEKDLKITVMAGEEHLEHYSSIHCGQKKDKQMTLSSDLKGAMKCKILEEEEAGGTMGKAQGIIM